MDVPGLEPPRLHFPHRPLSWLPQGSPWIRSSQRRRPSGIIQVAGELLSQWARILFYGPLLGGCMLPATIAGALTGAWPLAIVAAAGLGIERGLWRASVAKVRNVRPERRAVQTIVSGGTRLDTWTEKTFRWSNSAM